MLRFKVDDKYPAVVRYVLEKRGWLMSGPRDFFHLYWRNTRFREDEILNASRNQYFNHFLNSGKITKKASFTYQLKQLRQKFGDIYHFFPLGYVFNEETYPLILERVKEVQKENFTWIIKPSVGSQGKGIILSKKIELPPNNNDNNPFNERFFNKVYTAQQYIDNPFLIKGYKFDLRIYALVTSFHPMTIYLYKEGLSRFATEKYDPSFEGDDFKYKHLTNTSINKFSPIFETGTSEFDIDITSALGFGSKSKRTLKQLIAYLKHNNINFEPTWESMKRSIILSLLPLCDYVPKTEANCFEIYGFDFLLDENLRPWMLEVNFSPSLGCECNVDQSVKENLIEDVLDTLNIQPPMDSSRKVPPEYFYNFMHRNSSHDENGCYGNFEKIFPFDERSMSAYYRLKGDQYKEEIVKCVRDKYGEAYVPSNINFVP